MRLVASRLDPLPGLRHGFFTRRHGVSGGPFASLNMGQRGGDEPGNVDRNRALAAAALGFPAERLVTLRQVHGRACLEVREPWPADDAPEADAVVTRTPGILLGVLSADCAPILLADPAAGVAGAAHAGWKGALGGVVESVVAAMRELGARPQGIVAAIGPCIAQASYEVGPELRERFAAEDPASAEHFAPVPASDRLRLDLKGYVERRLRRAGVESVEVLPHDTLTDEERFFSYRRTTQRGEAQFGIQLSAIGLAP